jgi:ferrous iron transport protein A
MTTLADLKVGDRGLVAAVEGTDDVSMRLLEMGLTPGIEVRILGKATLGDPIELIVRGYRLSVRKAEARRVAIEPSAS